MTRDEKIQLYIRERYSLSNEIAILRKEVSDLKNVIKNNIRFESLSEFDTYNNYVEECKNKVSEDLSEEVKDNGIQFE